MKYPKQLMKQKELIKIGFPKEFLDRAYRNGGIAFRINPAAINSPLIYDTQALEDFRVSQMKIDNQIYLRE